MTGRAAPPPGTTPAAPPPVTSLAAPSAAGSATTGETPPDPPGRESSLRIGMVVYGSLDAPTGAHLYDRKLADYLEAAGDDVDVVSIPERSYQRSVATNLSANLPRRLECCDVVLQDEICHPSLPLVNRRMTGTPVVAIVHHLSSDDPRNWWRSQVVRRLERRYLSSVDGYVFNSKATRDSVGRLVDTDPSVLAPPAGDRFEAVTAETTVDRSVRTAPVDNKTIHDRAMKDPFRVATAAASVTQRKGITTLIEGLDRVPTDWRLTITGDLDANRSYVERVRALVEKRGVADQVTLAGHVPDAAVASLLAESHLFALPSRYEAFGIGYLEGMGFGLPAIAAARGGARDVVDHGVNGYLVPPDDSGAVTDAIAPLAADRPRLARMGAAAFGKYRRHPTWTTTCERVRAFLHSFV